MGKTLGQYEAVIRPLMGDKRYRHSVNVADMAVKLAKKFGEDKEKAYTAAILHDCQKEADKDIMKKEMLESGFFVDPVEEKTFKLWHGIAGAYYVKNVLRITDNDILNAIRFHTVGRPNMSRLEKIVYLADMVSEEREYPLVEKYRARALEDLNDGMYQTLRWSILKTVGAGGAVPMSTFEAYSFYSQYKKELVE